MPAYINQNGSVKLAYPSVKTSRGDCIPVLFAYNGESDGSIKKIYDISDAVDYVDIKLGVMRVDNVKAQSQGTTTEVDPQSDYSAYGRIKLTDNSIEVYNASSMNYGKGLFVQTNAPILVFKSSNYTLDGDAIFGPVSSRLYPTAVNFNLTFNASFAMTHNNSWSVTWWYWNGAMGYNTVDSPAESWSGSKSHTQSLNPWIDDYGFWYVGQSLSSDGQYGGGSSYGINSVNSKSTITASINGVTIPTKISFKPWESELTTYNPMDDLLTSINNTNTEYSEDVLKYYTPPKDIIFT